MKKKKRNKERREGKGGIKERCKKEKNYGVGEKITDQYKKKQKMSKKILRYESIQKKSKRRKIKTYFF